jgi:hypothetical protein
VSVQGFLWRRQMPGALGRHGSGPNGMNAGKIVSWLCKLFAGEEWLDAHTVEGSR